MHYFKRNIGDYHKKAGRLSMIEHGAYTLLIDACYDRERFPTIDEAIDWCWARTAEEIAAVRFVLQKFFTLEDGCYTQSRISEEVASYRSRSRKNKEIAIAREDKRRTKRARNVHESSPEEDDSPPNHKPLTTNQVKEEANASVTDDAVTQQKPPCPSGDIVALYHELMPDNPQVKVLNDARKKAIRARWKEAASLTCSPFGYSSRADGVAAWRKFFAVCAESDFLTGKAPSLPGKPPFVADIDFLMSPTGFAKCLENKYHRE